jgi:hypothetical protein
MTYRSAFKPKYGVTPTFSRFAWSSTRLQLVSAQESGRVPELPCARVR